MKIIGALLNVLGVLNALNVLNVQNVLYVLNVFNVLHGRIIGLLGLVYIFLYLFSLRFSHFSLSFFLLHSSLDFVLMVICFVSDAWDFLRRPGRHSKYALE